MGDTGRHASPRRHPARPRLTGALAAAALVPLGVVVGALPAAGSANTAGTSAGPVRPHPVGRDYFGSYGGYNDNNLCAPPADTVPPTVHSVTVSPSSVDVTSGPQTVQVSADVTDATGSSGDPSGVRSVFVDFSGRYGGFSGRLKLASGTRADGTWQGEITIPTAEGSGTYHLRDIDATDANGNDRDYVGYGKNPSSPDDVRLQSGWDTTVAVTSGPSTQPQRPGRLRSFAFHPATIDAREGARRVRVTATLSGPAPQFVYVRFNGKGAGRHYVSLGGQLHQSGENTWTGRIRVGQWLGEANTRASLFADYNYQQVRPPFLNYGTKQLRKAGFATELKVLSGVDTTRPFLTGLAVTPNSVNTRSGPATATVTAAATDTGSGVRSIRLYAEHPHRPFGGTSVSLHPDGDHWTGTLTFPGCGPRGNWQLSAYLSDRAGNSGQYDNRQLAASDMPGYVHVDSRRGDVRPPQISGATASAADDTITLNFSEPVRNVSTSTLAVFAMAPAAQRYQQPTTVTAITCNAGTTRDVDCSGAAEPVTSAVLSVDAMSSRAHYQVWSNLGAVTTQLTDVVGNPLSWQWAAAEVQAD